MSTPARTVDAGLRAGRRVRVGSSTVGADSGLAPALAAARVLAMTSPSGAERCPGT